MNQLPKISKVTVKQHYSHCLNIAAGVAGGVLSGLFIYYSSDFGLGVPLSVGCCAAIINILAVYHYQNKQNLHAGYSNLLEKIDLHQLIQLTHSQELDDTERGLVVKYLNENHSGWSISKSIPS